MLISSTNLSSTSLDPKKYKNQDTIEQFEQKIILLTDIRQKENQVHIKDDRQG